MPFLEAAISHIQTCQEICRGLTLYPSDPTMSLLAVYEFEARLVLDPSEAGRVLDAMKDLSQCEPKNYETMAGCKWQRIVSLSLSCDLAFLSTGSTYLC